MPGARLLAEAAQFSTGSIAFARQIDHASSGESLGRIVRATMEKNAGAYAVLREAVHRRVGELGGAGEAEGLFMLAADMATTETLAENLKDDQRAELRALWVDLLSRS
jgi:hypothetical protein